VAGRGPGHIGYVRCDRCGLRFYPDGTAPRERYNGDYFASYQGGDYYETEVQRRREARVRLELIRSYAPQARDLLEVGSAAGFFLDEARAQSFNPTGIEPAAEVAKRAREDFGLDVRAVYAEDAELPTASFDVACSWRTVEHIPSPIGVMRAVRASLRSGGLFFVEVPNGSSLLAQRLGERWGPLEPEVHVGQWTPAALTAALERAGFSLEAVNTVPFVIYRHNLKWLRYARLAARQRCHLPAVHPSGNELLRAVARVA
jgi:SAM-dependent methyltransferase